MNKDPKPRCLCSTVDAQTKIVLNGVEHGGTVAHRCKLEESDHDTCECECGHRWVKNFKGVRP